ncbi:MAG: hypothetical protein K6G47_07695 [Clostridia bacterium]|nr:hypothetical protein [Clostridia bacterium]
MALEPGKNDYEMIDNLLDNQSVSEDDKEALRLAKYVYTEYQYIFHITLDVSSNSNEEKDTDVNISYFGIVDTYLSHKTISVFKDHVFSSNKSEYEYRILVLWLNDKLPERYDIDNLPGCYYDDLKNIVDYLNTTPNIEDFESYIEENDYSFLKDINDFDYSKSADKDSQSLENLYIGNLLVENYFAYNNLLPKKTVNFEYTISRKYYIKLFEIYKKYGNAVFGKDVDGIYVIDNYDEMFGELDEMIMESFNLAQKDFR